MQASRRFFAVLLVFAASSALFAQTEEFDSYKIRISSYWFHSSPSGSLQGSGQRGAGVVDFERDLSFSDIDTLAAKFDWRFARKHHLYFVVSPLSRSRQKSLTRTFSFQGQTFDAGLVAESDIKANLYAPGYQYDIFRRRRWHLGLAVQFDLFDIDATIAADTQTVNGVSRPARTASGSLLAPIPVAGPEFRLYLTNSPRVFVEGNVYGMYLFGYGNFVSSGGTLGVTLTKNLSANAGYQLGSRLTVKNNASDRIGIRLTQTGSIVGLQFTF
jgi:hypothetical protein